MSSVSSLMSVSALALALAWSGAMPAAAESAPTPPAKPSATASKDSKSTDAKSKDAHAKDAKSKDGKTADSKSKDAKAKDAKGKDTKSKDAKSSTPAKPATAAKPAASKSATTKSSAGKPAAARVAPTVHQPAPTVGASSSIPGGDLAALKVAVNAARNGRAAEAMGAAQQLDDRSETSETLMRSVSLLRKKVS